MPAPPRTQTSPGFTILELLVVLAIVGILIGVLTPTITRVNRDWRVQAAYNTIAIAVPAARGYATKEHVSFANKSDPIDDAKFSGAAIVFTPAGELRFVENDQVAKDGSSQHLEPKGWNGYADIGGIDYARLVGGVGVAGIAKPLTGSANNEIIAPPFAIRFDEKGVLIAGVNSAPGDRHRLVMYDGDYNGQHFTSSSRPSSGYNPNPYDPESTHDPHYPGSAYWDSSHWNATAQRYELPFEQLETVIGVIVYSKADFEEAQLRWGSSSENAIRAWLQQNGQVMLFSRYTGAVIRERGRL